MKKHRVHAQSPYLQFDGDTPRAAFPAPYRPRFFERIFHFFFQIEPDKNLRRSKRQPYREALASPYAYPPIQDAGLDASHYREIQQALKDWKSATAYFESVSDPELIDYAVFEMEAAQKRYMYLLQAVRNKEQSPL